MGVRVPPSPPEQRERMFKTCCRCNVEKLTSEFRKDANRTDGFQSHCKKCRRADDASRYTQAYRAQIVERNGARAKATREKILAFRLEHPCIKCGEADPSCLDFHHVDPTQKDFQIGGRPNASWKSIKAEIDKCVVLCANCHRKFHAGRFDLPA